MWDWTVTQKVTSHNTQFNIIYIMRRYVLSSTPRGRPDFGSPHPEKYYLNMRISFMPGSEIL